MEATDAAFSCVVNQVTAVGSAVPTGPSAGRQEHASWAPQGLLPHLLPSVGGRGLLADQAPAPSALRGACEGSWAVEK